MSRKPDHIDDAKREAIARLVNAGVPIPQACEASGVRWSHASHWMRKGRGEDAREPYTSFYQAMMEAKARWEAGAVMRITAAGKDDWKAAAWLLERRASKRWASASRLEHSGKDGGPIETSSTVRYVVAVPPEESADEG